MANEKPPAENESEKRKAKDYVVIGVVVILAFGLTVMMVMYLARVLKPPVSAAKLSAPALLVTADNEGTVQITEAPADVSPIDGIARPFENNTVFAIPPDTFPAAPSYPTETVPAPAAAASVPARSTPPAVSTAPAPAAPSSRAPVITPVTGGYMLQLFAGRNEDNVKAEIAKYKDLRGIHIERFKDGPVTWYRARCCTVPTKAEAEKLKAEIADKYPSLKPNVVQ